MENKFKSLIDRDEEENMAQGIYLAIFCFFIVACSVGAFLWFLFNEIYL